LVSAKTELPEGSRFPQTVSLYRCSNEPCQKEKNRETAKRIKIQKDREDATKKYKAKNHSPSHASRAN